MILLLEFARGLAALWVFLFHAKQLFENSSLAIYQFAEFGSLGVPMFFVISGYVITYSAESSLKNSKSPFIFLKARFLRIYPTFWVSVIVVLAMPVVLESISSLKTGIYIAPENLLSKFNATEWLNFLLLSKVFWATSHDLQAEFNAINSVYWTLAIEFQFYLVVFFALLFGKFYRYIIFLISLAALFVMWIPLEMNYGLFIHDWPSFSIGVFLAYLHRNGIWFNAVLKNRLLQLIAAIAVIGLIICFIGRLYQNKIYFALCFGILLWVISDAEKIFNSIKNSDNKFFFWILEPWLILGTMSYSVYLLHGKIYQLSNMLVRQICSPTNVLFGLLTIVGTLILCYPFYLFVERRFLSKNYKVMQQQALART